MPFGSIPRGPAATRGLATPLLFASVLTVIATHAVDFDVPSGGAKCATRAPRGAAHEISARMNDPGGKDALRDESVGSGELAVVSGKTGSCEACVWSTKISRRINTEVETPYLGKQGLQGDQDQSPSAVVTGGAVSALAEDIASAAGGAEGEQDDDNDEEDPGDEDQDKEEGKGKGKHKHKRKKN